MSADGDIVLWSSTNGGMLVSQYTNAFATVQGLASGSIIASDKKNDSVFYGATGSTFYLSTDGAKTFQAKATLGASTAPVKIVVHPNITGDVWVSTDKGLFHSTDLGTSFIAISGVSQVRWLSPSSTRTRD